MKSLIASLILLLLLIGAVSVNSVYVQSVCGDISDLADELCESGYESEKVSRLISLWDKHEGILSLSVESDELKRMKDLVSSLPTLKEKTSSDEFVRACRLISDLSDELKSYERISFDSIL